MVKMTFRSELMAEGDGKANGLPSTLSINRRYRRPDFLIIQIWPYRQVLTKAIRIAPLQVINKLKQAMKN